MKTILASILAFAFNAFVINLTPVDAPDAVSFIIKNFGINTRGTINGLKGGINWQPDNLSASSVNVSVDVATINTAITARDKDLQKEAYFNSDKYPSINFTSTQISGSNGTYTITGNLTIKGVTKVISFPFTVTPSDNGYLFEGKFSINRLDFGVGGNSMVLGDNVEITLKVQANP
jgi:polyisoprenoid-binding protein YceI